MFQIKLTDLTAVLLLATLASSSVVHPPSKKTSDTFELLILHNNDMHARFEQTSQLSGACTTSDREAGKCYGGFPRVAYVVKEARQAAASGEGPPVLYLNAGDTYTGTAWFTIYKWKIAAEFINALQPDAVSLGNHEFDNGINGLTPFIRNLTCPILAANLVLDKVPDLAKETNLKSSFVFNISNNLIGVIGYLTPETKVLAVPNDVEYIDEIIAIKNEVKNLQNKGINIIIALGHSGYLKDIQIAQEVDGIDLVIGGHTNTFLWNGTIPDSEEPQGPYPTYVNQASGKSVPVVQAYAYTKYLGRLHMVFDSFGELIKADGVPLLLDTSIPQDPDVTDIIERYRSDILNVSDKVIGNTTVKLVSTNCKHLECNIGNMITDGMAYRYASDNNWTEVPIATIQGGAIRSSIVHVELPTNITKGDLLTVMPFEGNLVAVTMNGITLLQMIEHAVSNYNLIDPRGEFSQFSGIKVIYDVSKPSGSRAIKVTVRQSDNVNKLVFSSAEDKCWECDTYSEVEKDHIYKVIMPGFTYNGGDGFWMFRGLPVEKLPYSELMSTEFYVNQNRPVSPLVEGRITVIGEPSGSSALRISLAMILISLVPMFY